MVRAVALGALLAAVSGAAPLPQNGRIAFTTSETTMRHGLVSISPAGGAPVVIDSAEVNEIVQSPDGSRLAYSARRFIHTAHADGRSRTKLGEGSRPSWAPDGRQLVYQRPDRQLVIAAADGAAERSLGITGDYPAWSPDGNWIAFFDADTSRVQAIRPDGTGRRTIAERGDHRPIAWSPSGEWLSFGARVDSNGFLHVARLDGSGLRVVGITFGESAWARSDDRLAAWSEEGLRIQTPDGRFAVTVAGLDSDAGVAWSPDGRAVAVGSRARELVLVDARTGTSRKLGLRGPAAWSADGTRLVYSRAGALWTMPAAGGAPRLVARGAYGRPAWLESGRIVVFRGLLTRSVIATVTPTGTGRRVLVTGAEDFIGLSWSPTGSHLAYVRDPERSHRLEVVSARGGRPRLVAAGAGSPTWSPDGTQLAYLHRGIQVLRLAGRRPRRIARAGDYPAWSPDGRHLAFIRDANGGLGALFVVPATGGTPRRLERDGVQSFSWSPDGRWIVFDDDSLEIAVIGVDGKGRRRIARGDPDDETGVVVGGPVWSPDGRRIVYSSEQLLCGTKCSEYSLELVSPAGKPLGAIDHPFLTVDDVAWSPDGTRLVGLDGESSVVSLDPLGRRARTVARNARAVSWQPMPRRR